MWACGLVSPQMVQHTMRLMLNDLNAHASGTLSMRMIEKLEGLGTHGAHPQNMHSQLVNFVHMPHMPKPHGFPVPLRHTQLGRFHKDMDMLLPHELFASIYHHYPSVWRSSICPSEFKLQSFWRAVQNGIHFQTHPVRHREKNRSKRVPL